MLIRLHPASGVPLYLQIEAQVKQAIAGQVLPEGAALVCSQHIL